MKPIKLTGVREYCEGMDVQLDKTKEGRLIIVAYNEAGFNSTEIDLLDLTDWILKNQALISKLQ
jgi:hypothetical protein